MLTIFSRRELFITFSMEEQAKIRNILSGAGIDYSLKFRDQLGAAPLSAGRAALGRFGESTACNCEYVFYVHKRDLEQARYLIK